MVLAKTDRLRLFCFALRRASHLAMPTARCRRCMRAPVAGANHAADVQQRRGTRIVHPPHGQASTERDW